MEYDEKELVEMWGTVTEIKPYGFRLQLDEGDETLVPSFWSKMWGHDAESIEVGARVRCAVQVEWKPTYFVRAVLTVVHEGGQQKGSG